MLDRDELLHRLFESGNYLSSQGQRPLAIACYEAVLREQPEHEWALNNYGYNLFEAGQLASAEAVLRGALEKYPANSRILANLAAVLERQRRGYEAIPLHRRLIELVPHDAEYHLRLGNACLGSGCISEALRAYGRAIELRPDYEACLINYLLATNYSDEMSAEAVALAHRRLARHWSGNPRSRAEFPNSREPGRRIKVGYNSTDYGHHPVGKIMAAIVPAHDRTRFEIVCYHDGDANDGFTARIERGADQFHRTRELDNQAFTELVRSHGIDLFVELNGYTGGRNRLGAIALRVAPIQISFLGYPNTTGHPEVDYRITDRFTDPPGPAERLAIEKSLRLEAGFLCFEPPPVPPLALPDPAARNGYITFGSFNNPSKISPSCLAAFAQILQQVPDSRLLVKYGSAFESEELRSRWRGLFADRGVSGNRLIFENAKPSLSEHLACMGSVDICLDPFPYQGTMTTLESLTVGVPVVTLAGETYCRRASSALLLRLEYDSLVAHSIPEYIDVARRLAENASERLQIRSTIGTRFLSSEICDVAGFVRDLERAFEEVRAAL